MPIPKLLVTNFYSLTFNRDFAQAERTLKEIRGKLTKVKWNEGYLHALEGMLNAHRGKNDRYALINQLQNDKDNITDLMEDFRHRSRNLINSEFDRGFFTAWADLTHYLALKEGMTSKRGRKLENEDKIKIQTTLSQETDTTQQDKDGELAGEKQTHLNGTLKDSEEEYPESKPCDEEGQETGKPDIGSLSELQR
jgi:hypothetical protein